MRTPRPVAAVSALLSACLLLVAGACATPEADGGATSGASDAGASASAEPRTTAKFGSMHRFASGLVVIVSEPTSFQPSRSAYPPAENAVAFEVTVRNETSHRYRISNMSFQVIADRQDAKRLTDPTQGFTGVASSSEGLPTECETQLSLAFAVPAEPTHLKLTVSPQSPHTSSVTYFGRMHGSTDRAR